MKIDYSKIKADDLLSIAEAARLKGVSRATMYDWSKRGLVDTMRLAERTYIIYNQKYIDIEPSRGVDTKREDLSARLKNMEDHIKRQDLKIARLKQDYEREFKKRQKGEIEAQAPQ